MCRQCVLKESLQSNEIYDTFEVEPVCNLYKIALGLCVFSYLIFVNFFTRAKFLENKIYTEKRQFFALNL